ncbi:hypothetical protein HMI54_003393 [Coelomomyces lativittatus]|nr:hypothetical protein HMI54_003393 [Coelomomyces lativittatus]
MTDESRALHGGWESLFLHLLSTRNQSKCMLLINTSSSLSSSSSSGGSSVPSSKVLPWVKISTQLALVAQYLPTCHPDAQKQAGIQAWVSTFLKTSPPPATSQRVVDGLVFILDGIETQLRQDQACTAQLSQWCTTFTQRVHHDMQEELSRFQTSCVTSKTSFELFEEGKVAMAIHGILKNALLACQHEHRSSVHPMEFNSLFERFQTLLELATSHPLIEQPLWMTVPRPPVTQAFMQEIYWQGFGVQLFTWSTFVAGAFMELYPLYPGGLYMLNVSLGLAGWTWLKSKIVRRRILRSWEKQLIQARKENMDKHRARLLKFVQTPLQEINEILSFNMNEREKRHMERLNHVQRLKNEIEKIKIH